MKEELAKILLSSRAVKFEPKNPFHWTSGIIAPIYCDTRILNSIVGAREKIVDGFVKMAKNLDFEIIAGAATGGISWAAYVAQKLNKPMIYIRKEAKGHGTGKRVEGILEKNKKVLMVEDVVSTGGSSISAVEGVREAGGIVENILAILWYQFEETKSSFEENNINFLALSDFSSLVKVSDFSDDIKQDLIDFQKDPKSWRR